MEEVVNKGREVSPGKTKRPFQFGQGRKRGLSNMEEAAVKEESKVKEEKEGLNQVHDDVELQQQQPEPSCVDSLIVEMQKFVGVEKPDEIEEGQDGSAPSVVLEADDDVVSNVESVVQRESEVCVRDENDKIVSITESDVCPEREVCLKVENDKAVSNAESDVWSESEVGVKVESNKVVGNADTSVHPESVVGVKVKSDKVISNVDSDVQRESEVAVMVESDKVISNVDSDVQRESEVAVMVESDKVISNVDSDVQRDSEVTVMVESDKVISKVESDVQRESEVAAAVVGDADSNMHPESEVAVAVEGDSLVENVDSAVHQKSEVCVETPGEENGKKEVVVKDVPVDKSVELGGGAATGEPDNNVDQTAQAAMEIDDVGREGKTIQDGVASKANEAHTAKVDAVVSRVEPDMCGESGVAKEKLTDGVSSKANPSSKPLTNAEADSVYSKLENIVPHDSKIAKEKLVDVASRKTKRSHSHSGPPSVVKQLKANHVFKVERGMPQDSEVSVETESESDDDNEKGHALTGQLSSKTKFSQHHNTKEQLPNPKVHVEREVEMKSSDTERTFMLEPEEEGNESGTEEEQAAFMREVDKFHKEKHLEFKPPKFYKEELNLLKLWRAVIKLGGYEKVTACKLWRQIGESFNPPKTCTTVSWTFRIFYEKALVEFEKYRWHGSELALPETSRAEIRADGSGSGRTLRDAAARAMQGWHSQRLTGNGEEKQLSTTPKMDKQLKSSGLLKRKKFAPGEYSSQATHMRATKPRLDMTVFDIGPPADWVKINVKRFSDCFEVYALVPGLLREEVHVQSDPIGRLIITGQPMQLDNPWGVTPFKKVVSLPSRIDPHQTSAVVTLNGQLFVRVPLEQSDY